MGIMVRRILLLLLATWGGCGGREEDRAVVLRLFMWRPDDVGAWDEAITRFEREHRGVRVERQVGPNNSTQLHDLLSQRLRNRDPSLDVFLMDTVWTAEFAAAGWALPLDGRLDAGERAAFFPGCLEAVTHEGRIHGLPLFADAGLLYYRSDLVPPPRTWPELVALARERASGDVHGYSAQLKQYEGLVCNALELVGSNGGDLLRPGEPAAVEAIRFLRDRIVGEAAPRGVLTYEEQESLDLFASGGALFLRSWPYAWRVCQQSAVKGKVAIAPLPAFEGHATVSALGGWNLGISAFSRHTGEAWALAAFLASEEVQALFARRTGKPVSRRAAYSDPEVLAAYPHFRGLAPIVEHASPRPRSPVYPQISHVLQRYIHRAIAEPDADVEGLMREASREIAEAQARVGR
jgi:multiple sugar transport system substrate-binding protein